MNKSERAELKKRIEALLISSVEAIKGMEDMTQPIKPENSLGRISRMDAINNKSVQEAALRTKRRKYENLKLALTKIDDPAFGSCRQCKQHIQQARLMYMPESSTCVRCAK